MAGHPEYTKQVIVYTTVQPTNIMFPIDAELLHRARERPEVLAKKAGLILHHFFTHVGNFAPILGRR